MKRVTGIGGIFFKTKDTKQTSEWYAKHLGVDTGQYGAMFPWRDDENPEQKRYTLFSLFSEKSDYFGDPQQQFMINFRVENIERLVEALKAEGVTVLDEIASYDYGKFVHILDADGNKIELWEAVDE